VDGGGPLVDNLGVIFGICLQAAQHHPRLIQRGLRTSNL
jgi:hypothetical protein